MRTISLIFKLIFLITLLHSIVVIKLNAQITDELKITSLNVWGLPIKLPGSKQNLRFNAIIDSINMSESDVICLQECFSSRFRKKLNTKLNSNFQSKTDFTDSRNELIILNMDKTGGLITFSKHPIISEHFFPYPISSSMNPEEKLGRKGFLLSQISTPQGIINVVNTHLYAGNYQKAEQFRMEQIKFMYETLQKLEAFDQYPLFLVGDLNINHPETLIHNDKLISSKVYNFLESELGFIDTNCEVNEFSFTYDCERNKFSGKKDGPQKLDYIFFKKTEYTELKAIHCQLKFDGVTALSDHFGFEATMKLSASGKNKSTTIADFISAKDSDNGITP